MACLAKAPRDRPQSSTQLLQVLETINRTYYLNWPANKSSMKVGSRMPSESVNGNNSHIATKSDLPVAVEQIFWQAIWPPNKPIQEIVFPRLLDTEKDSIASLWLMLPKADIQKRSHSIRYNQFLFIKLPHPMLLWLTVLYNKQLGPKWLPCYLDMQEPQNQKMVYSLASNERYPLILFTLEAPNLCTSVMSSYINDTQRQTLKTWLEQSKTLPPSSQAHLSKNLLKQQYKQMQSQIQEHLASMPSVG